MARYKANQPDTAKVKARRLEEAERSRKWAEICEKQAACEHVWESGWRSHNDHKYQYWYCDKCNYSEGV